MYSFHANCFAYGFKKHCVYLNVCIADILHVYFNWYDTFEVML